MINEILSEKDNVLMLGNEAVVRGALESGVGFSTTYPGTPATEIGDAFAAIAKKAGIYFEYSTNEKVAVEVAAGAALSGVRSITSFKHYGLNVASDSVFPIAYSGVKAGMVIVVADDPNCWSSVQSEEDSRYFSRIAHLPMLEPSDAQECKEFTKTAFGISEEFGIPVFLRLTTRVAHESGIVSLGKIIKGKTEGSFVKDVKWKNFPPQIIKTHEGLHEKLEKISASFGKKLSAEMKGKGNDGVITSGISYGYVREALDDMGISVPILKLGITYPLPKNQIKKFLKNLKSVLVVEELDAVLENDINVIAREVNPKIKIFGKNVLPSAGELTEELVISALTKVTGKKFKFDFEKHKRMYDHAKIVKRFPVLCPGCPHRATFYAAKIAVPDAVFVGDIGCYLLGVYPPLETTDILFSMGASQGLAHGISKVSKQKVIAFIGDSTLFHAGVPGLMNIVYNKSNPLVIVLDNRTTAMTGHQPHPGLGITGMGEPTKEISIMEIVKACGVENVKIIDSYNIKEMVDTIKNFVASGKPSVIISARECRLLSVRRMKNDGIKIPKFKMYEKLSDEDFKRLNNFGCPAIVKENNSFVIDDDLCLGCSVCAQLCPGKIKVKE